MWPRRALHLLEGEVDLLGASSRTRLVAGSFALVPPDTEHGLRVEGGGPARCLAIWPAALDGFLEDETTLGPDDVDGLSAVRARHGMMAGRDRRPEFGEEAG